MTEAERMGGVEEEDGGDAGNHSSPTPPDARPAMSPLQKRRQLSSFVDHLEVPGKVTCERAIATESALSSRSWKYVVLCTQCGARRNKVIHVSATE